MWQNKTSNECIFEIIAKRDAANGGGESSPGSTATFPSPWIKASSFASHSFEWFAFASFIYPQISQINADYLNIYFLYFDCVYLCGFVENYMLTHFVCVVG
jgi:hypothetical protein